MKTMKRIAALMLALCMLIALPMAVSAEEATPTELKLVNAELVGKNQIRLTFNQAVASLNDKHYVGLSLYNESGSSMMAYKWNEDTHSYDCVTTGEAGEENNVDQGDGVDTWKRAQWGASDVLTAVTGRDDQLIATLSGSTTLADVVTICRDAVNAGGQLKFRIQEDSGLGGTDTKKVETLYAKNDESVKLNGTNSIGNTNASDDQVQKDVSQYVMDAKATADGAIYNSVTGALAVAGDGVKITMLQADTADAIKVPAGVTLDLNGQTLTMSDYSVVAAFGFITDRTDGNGKLAINTAKGHVILQPGNPTMPLYDPTEGSSGYRFYGYELVAKGYKEISKGKTNKYGVGLEFTNAAAYDLLANGGVEVSMNIKCEGTDFNYPFKADKLEEYAEKCATALANNKTIDSKALALTVSGIGERTISVTATVVSTKTSVTHTTETFLPWVDNGGAA